MAKLKGGTYVAGTLTAEGAVTAPGFQTAGGAMISAAAATPPTADRLAKFGSTGYDILDSILSETSGVVTAAGALAADTVRIKDNASYYLTLQSSGALAAARTLTINVADADRSLTLNANLTVGAITSGHVLYGSADNTISSEASLSVSRGGTGLATLAAYSLLYGNATSPMVALAPNTSATPMALLMTGTGTEGAAPVWSVIPNAALQNSSITINEETVALGGSITIEAGGSINHNSGSTEAEARPVLRSTTASPITDVYSCSAVTIKSSVGQLNATSFNASSSRKAKTDIKRFEGSALDIVDSTEICTYYYKLDKAKEHLKIGFIADDTHEFLATKNHDTMDLASSVGVLIKAVQELHDKLKVQAAEIERLKRPFWKRWFS